ncbi:uncharacterized protein MYCFIDRAFT_171416 [Pseudocercospora fijiensis CIRAD86]|uniref:F-box domain-containing protein n=1 Tax=Pseudocercospora fijiensis (strain CIRAD86) TaxID=383855 RepID=M3B841_PSEFD|nr:uncharacterized protein MYCFIDRAFT_171416 [Pseudocercospora fijiensis CIRAD86]EME85488.1 hypothetical protein MYCFIDRAFT_171416 [Pseudocercospora fijiensis CIRAD86]
MWHRRLTAQYSRKYTVPQLRAAIKTRLGYDPPKSKSKEYYANVMIQADYTIFRLLDLPAEMRNQIYRQLLTIGSGKLSTAILRVSKQVHSEARAILYNDNVYKLGISIDHHLDLTHVHRNFKTGNLSVSTADNREQQLREPDFVRMENTAHVARFKHISLTLAFHNRIRIPPKAKDDERMCNIVSRTMSQHLWPLVNFLTISKQLRTLEVVVEQTDVQLSEELMGKALWPLSLLGHGLSIKFVGISDQMANDLRSEVGNTPSPEPGMNTDLLKARSYAQIIEALQQDMADAEYGINATPSQRDQYDLGLSDEMQEGVKSIGKLFNSAEFADAERVNAITKGTKLLQDSIEDKSLPTHLLAIIDKFKRSEGYELRPEHGRASQRSTQHLENQIREWRTQPWWNKKCWHGRHLGFVNSAGTDLATVGIIVPARHDSAIQLGKRMACRKQACLAIEGVGMEPYETGMKRLLEAVGDFVFFSFLRTDQWRVEDDAFSFCMESTDVRDLELHLTIEKIINFMKKTIPKQSDQTPHKPHSHLDPIPDSSHSQHTKHYPLHEPILTPPLQVKGHTTLLGIAKYELQYGGADLLQAIPGHCALAATTHRMSDRNLESLWRRRAERQKSAASIVTAIW